MFETISNQSSRTPIRDLARHEPLMKSHAWINAWYPCEILNQVQDDYEVLSGFNPTAKRGKAKNLRRHCSMVTRVTEAYAGELGKSAEEKDLWWRLACFIPSLLTDCVLRAT